MSDNIRKNLQKERELLQEKMYTSWLNYRLGQAHGSPQITSLFEDLRDGKLLLTLLQLLTGQTLKPGNGEMRVHHLTNLSKVFRVLTEQGIKTVGISTESICDGNITSTLGLCWHVIYHFQVQCVVINEDQPEGSAEKALLGWCHEIAQTYAASDVKSFQPNRWKTGYMLNAIIHSFNPKLFQYHTLTSLTDADRVQHAVDLAYNHYEVPKLFSATDFEQNLIDNKTLVLYVSMLREKMVEHVEVDTEILPSAEQIQKEQMEKLQAELEELKKALEENEKSELLNPPSNLNFRDSKEFSSKYKDWEKRLDALAGRVEHMKEEGKSAECAENSQQFAADCDDVLKRINGLKDSSKACNGDLKDKRLKAVKDKLDDVKQDVNGVKLQLEEVAGNIIPDAAKEDLLKSGDTCKHLIQELKQMQAAVKDVCALVDEAYNDKSLPKAIRQELKSDAIEVLEQYAKLMESLEAEGKKANTLLGDKAKGIEERFNMWSDKVQELDVWLTERTNKFENMLIEYGTLGHLKEVSSEIKHLVRDIGEAWKNFEVMAAEWNSELCDQLNDDQYADVLTDIQAKFNKLNEVATKTKSLISGMLSQKRAEDVICANLLTLKTYADRKETEINAESDADKLQVLSNIINDKESEVKVFLKNSSEVLKKNKYDDKSVTQLENDLQIFCDQWDRVKEACRDKKMRAEHLAQTQAIQRETERNLIESLRDWQKVLDEFIIRMNNADIGDSVNLQALSQAIEELEALAAEIQVEDGKIKEYERNSTTLINTLEGDVASKLSVDFELFFKNWNEMKANSHSTSIRLKEQHQTILLNEDSIMGEWRNKHMVTEEWLDNVAHEISVYSEPDMDFDAMDDYFAKLDELENKVNAENESLDGSILEGKSLAEGDQLILDHNKETIKSVVDAFAQKKTHVHNNLLLAKQKVGDMKEKRRLQKENEELLSSNLAEWEQTLQDNTDTLDICDVNEIHNLSDTQKAVDILETLVAEIIANDDKLSAFEISSQDSLCHLPADKAADFNVIFKVFLKSWDHCKDKAQERLSGLKMQLGQLRKNEEYVMNEWDTNASKTVAWLENAEVESVSFCSLPDNADDIQGFVSNYGEFVSKVSVKEESIIELRLHGYSLLETEKIQQAENVERIQNNISTFDVKLEAVKEALNNAKKFSEVLSQRMIVQKETEQNLRDSLADWHKVLHDYKRRYEVSEVKDQTLVHEMQASIKQLEELQAEIDGNAKKLHAFMSNSQVLFNTINPAQATEIKNSYELFYSNWNSCKSDVRERLQGLKELNDQALRSEDKMMMKWQVNTSPLYTWLTNAITQCSSFYKLSGKQIDIERLLVEFETFEHDVSENEGIINQQISDGTLLIATNKLKLNKNKEKVQDDLTYMTQKKSELQASMLKSQKFLARLQKDNVKQDELKNNLILLKKYLKEKEMEFNAICKENHDVTQTMTKIILLLEQYNSKDSEVESLKTFSAAEVGSSNKHNKKHVEQIHSDVGVFSTEWKEFKDVLQKERSSLQIQLKEQHQHELNVMREWEQHALKTHKLLDDSTTNSSYYCTYPKEPVDIDQFVSGFQELQDRMGDDEKEINEQIQSGSSLLANNTIKSNENKEKIQKDVNTFNMKRSSVQTNLLNAQKFLAELQKERARYEELKYNLLILRRYLEEKKIEVGALGDESKETAKSKFMLLLEQCNPKDEEVDSLKVSVAEMRNSCKHNKKEASLLYAEVDTFSTDWNQFKEMIRDERQSLEAQLDEEQKNEHNIISVWDKDALHVHSILDISIKSSLYYCKHPDESVSLERFTSGYQELCDKVQADKKKANGLLNYGMSLLADGFKSVEKKEKVNKDMALVSQKMAALDENLSNGGDLMDNLTKQKKEEDQLWHDLTALKQYLKPRVAEYKGINDDRKPQVTIKTVKLLLDDLIVRDSEVESIQDFSIEVVSNIKNKENARRLVVDVNTFSKEWNDFKSTLQTRLSSLSGIEKQDAKEKELKSKLADLRVFLRLQQQEFNELPTDILPVTLSLVTELVSKLDQRNDSLDELQTFSIEVISGNKHNKEAATKLLSDVNTFIKDWNTFKDSLQSKLIRLHERVEEENQTEGKMMDDWKNVSTLISSWFDQAEGELGFSSFSKDATDQVDAMMNQSTDLDSDETFKEMNVGKEVIDRLTEEEKSITEKLRYGNALLESNDLKSEGSKESIQKDITMHTERKLILDDKLLHAKKLLEEMSLQSDKDGEMERSLSLWKKYLKEKEEHLNSISKDKDIHVAMQHIEVLLTEITQKDNDVEIFVKTSESTLCQNKYNNARTATIQSDLSQYFMDWNSFVDSTQGLKDSLQARIDDAKESEKLAIEQWQGQVQEVEEWLMVAEEESNLYAEPPDDFEALEEFSSKFENLISKLATEEATVDEKLKYSSELADSDQLVFDNNRENIRKAVSALTNRKLALNGSILNTQKWLASTRERLRGMESEEFMSWCTDANAVKETLRAYESVGREEVVKTVKEGELALERQKVLMDELAEHQGTIDDLLGRGDELLGNKKLGQAKHNELSHEIKIIDQRWKSLLDRIGDVYDGYQNILSALKVASEEKIISLLNRVISFNDWLTFARQQLHGGRKPSTFVEYIQRENGLEKLATDLESRKPEYDYLEKVLVDLSPENAGQLSEKGNELLAATQRLKNDWTSLLTNIDEEFQSVYGAIKNLLETRRNQIESSLTTVKENLPLVHIVGNNQDQISLSAQKLGELNNELPKLKGNVNKLTQQTSTLNDISIQEADKQAMIQSTNQLVAEYEDCTKQIAEATKGFQECVIKYFEVECDKAKTKLDGYRSEIPMYNTDEEDLNILKEYLIQDQQVMEDIKSEHIIIDDMEKFAEQISSSGVLTSQDQVTIAEHINEVLKSFDLLKSQCKAGTNRVYAVTMHIFNHHLQSFTEEIVTVNKDVHQINAERNNIADLDHAALLLQNTQNLRIKVGNIKCQISLVTEKIKDWIGANIIELGDVRKLSDKDSHVVEESNNVAQDIEALMDRIEEEVRSIVLKKLEDFQTWLPTVQKRSEEGDEIGPDFETVNKQIQEMKVIEGQALQMSFSGVLDDDKIFALLSDEDKEMLKKANEEWITIKTWVDKRLVILSKTENLWDEFKARKVDLVEYLRDVENELNVASGLDLNDTSNVEARTQSFKEVTAGMETRKYHVANLVEIADQLIDLISSESEAENSLASGIQLQVTDILDLWNSRVKRSIELKTILHASCKKFEELEKAYNEVHQWIANLNDILNQFTVDARGEHIDELRVSLEEKQKQEDEMREKLSEVNAIDEELSKNGEILSQYSLEGSITELNEDFNAVATQLEQLRKFRGKARILSRRVRGGTRKLFTRGDQQEAAPQPIEAAS